MVATRPLGNVLWVDMEGSRYTQVTLDLYRRIRNAHASVGLCIQAYLYRTAGDLEGLLEGTPLVRLVKGAYAEPGSIAFPKKAHADANYRKLAERLLDGGAAVTGARLAFATHDVRLIRLIQGAAAARGLARDAYEFQMLYGIQREEQRRLAAEGYRVRVLISYGAYWFPWYMRRLAERPANLWFVMRSMAGR
jgi:proline dehydrogenase